MKLTAKNRMVWFKIPRRRQKPGGFLTGCNTGTMRHARHKGECGRRTTPTIIPASETDTTIQELIRLARAKRLN